MGSHEAYGIHNCSDFRYCIMRNKTWTQQHSFKFEHKSNGYSNSDFSAADGLENLKAGTLLRS